MRFYVHDSEGRILRTGYCPVDSIPLQAATDETAVEGVADIDTQYVDTRTGEVKEKPNLPVEVDKTTMAADGIDTVTLANLPESVVLMEYSHYNIDDGLFEFTVDLPGEYLIKILATNYMPYELLVTAT